ncbi:MAG: hypothetical protein E6J66_10080 [Deltaproteobacteria bacterium]|nr:MAG: hypothetical protein E6J66_10080 [Deltaproteobacteria bacterium]
MKLWAAIIALTASPQVRADASFLERPLIVLRHEIQLHAAYEPLREDTGTNTADVHRVLLGLDVGVTDEVQLGLSAAPRIAPNGGFDHLAIRTTYLAHEHVAVRLDTGVYDTRVHGETPGFAGGIGMSLRIPLLAERVALISGRFTGLPPIGPRFSPWPSLSFADDLVTIDVNGRVRTASVGIPLGVLVQVVPLLAAQVRAGYRHVFGAYSSADYVPIGVDLLASTGTMDFIISAEMPRKLQAASNIYEGRVQLQARF